MTVNCDPISVLRHHNLAFWPVNDNKDLFVFPKPPESLVPMILEHKSHIIAFCLADYSDLVIPTALEVLLMSNDPALEDAIMSNNLDRIRTQTLETWAALFPDQRLASWFGKNRWEMYGPKHL